jgi:hypothetical protein
MADGHTKIEKFTAPAHAHTTAGAETTLTIPTLTDRHYDLLVNVIIRDAGGTSRRYGQMLHLMIENYEGTLTINSNAADTLDQSGATAYSVSVTTSGANVLVQATAEADAYSAAVATGVSVEIATPIV